jgi:uncharacterized protein
MRLTTMPNDRRKPGTRDRAGKPTRPPGARDVETSGGEADFEKALRLGTELFNDRRFFEAHEAWEVAWRAFPGEPAYFLHGLIQIAAGFVKLERREPRGAFLNLEKGRSKIARFAPSRYGLDVSKLLVETERWISVAREMSLIGRTEYDATLLPRLRLAPEDVGGGTHD